MSTSLFRNEFQQPCREPRVRANMAPEFSMVDFILGTAEGDLLHDVYLWKKAAHDG